MPRKSLEIHLEVDYVPCPPEKAEAWRAGLFLLLQLICATDSIPDSSMEFYERATNGQTISDQYSN